VEETKAVFPPLRQRIADATAKLENQLVWSIDGNGNGLVGYMQLIEDVGGHKGVGEGG